MQEPASTPASTPVHSERFQHVEQIAMDCQIHGRYMESGFLDTTTAHLMPSDGHCPTCGLPARVLQQDPTWQR